ncbi:MAG TPA: hypothetical protein VKC60_00740, partial [Opitutaceae bacterium]|nr:hypothetical protein [Opitutaceae bacterium]
FTPLIAFFAVTGALQVYNFHENTKDGSYTAPAWIEAAANVHKDQHLHKGDAAGTMKVLTVVMSVALLLTMVLGVVLAFKYGRSATYVVGSLVLGIVIPIVVIWLK